MRIIDSQYFNTEVVRNLEAVLLFSNFLNIYIFFLMVSWFAWEEMRKKWFLKKMNLKKRIFIWKIENNSMKNENKRRELDVSKHFIQIKIVPESVFKTILPTKNSG